MRWMRYLSVMLLVKPSRGECTFFHRAVAGLLRGFSDCSLFDLSKRDRSGLCKRRVGSGNRVDRPSSFGSGNQDCRQRAGCQQLGSGCWHLYTAAGSRATLWRNAASELLDTAESVASAVNEAGVIAGSALRSGKTEATVWSSGKSSSVGPVSQWHSESRNTRGIPE